MRTLARDRFFDHFASEFTIKALGARLLQANDGKLLGVRSAGQTGNLFGR
jgi:hypothetical protein